MSDLFGQACQEIFCSSVSLKYNVAAKKVVTDLINYINCAICSILMLGGGLGEFL